MLKKRIYIFIFFILLFMPLGRVLALETTLPLIPGLPAITSASTLPQYLEYFFMLGILAGGFMAFLSLVMAGIKLLLNAHNPGAVKEAKERMIGSLFGLALLMFSFVLLQTLNPELTRPTLQRLNPSTPPGVYLQQSYHDTGNAFGFTMIPTASAASPDASGLVIEPAPQCDDDTSQEKSRGFAKILHYCGASNTGPNLILEMYSGANRQMGDSSTERILECGQTQDISNVPSYCFAYAQPGVFLYTKPNCQGISTGPLPITQSGSIEPYFQNKIKSARIINGNGQNDPHFGFVLNRDPNNLGACSDPYMNFKEADINSPSNVGQCFNLSSDTTCITSANPPNQETDNTMSGAIKSIFYALKNYFKPQTANAASCSTIADCPAQAGYFVSDCAENTCVYNVSVGGTGTGSGGGDAVCDGNQAAIKLVKEVIGGPARAGAWTLKATSSAGVGDFSDSGDPNQSKYHIINAGTEYDLSESSDAATENYQAGEWSCKSIPAAEVLEGNTVTASAGQSIVCTIKNTYVPPIPAKLTVKKMVAGNTNDRFNLLINGSIAGTGANVGNLGTTGAIELGDGYFTVSETPGKDDNGTTANLSHYQTVFGGDCDVDGNIELAAGDSKACTITNTYTYTPPPPAKLTVKKDCGPNTSGAFNLLINGTIIEDTGENVGCGGGTSEVSLTVGSYTISETAGTETTLSNYTSIISGDCAANGTIKLASGDNKTCTIKNTRVQTLLVQMVCNPIDDPGKFNISIPAINGAANDLPCNNMNTKSFVIPNTIAGNYIVSQTAGSGTNLADYDTSFSPECAGTLDGTNKTCTITNTKKTGTPPPASDLIAHWKFDETSGNTAIDSSEKGNNGNVTGGTIWTTDGRLGGALNLGTTGLMVPPASQLWNFGSTDFTVAMWVKLNSLTGYQTLIGNYYSSGTSAWVMQTLTGTGKVAFYKNNRAASLTSSTAMVAGAWQHVAAVRGSGTLTLYINGVAAGSTALGNINASTALQISAGAYPLNGSVDDTRIYNRALNKDEIGALAGGNIVLPPQPAPILTINKILVPSNDPGAFNLQINGVVAGTGRGASNGGTTGPITLTANTTPVTIDEVAVAGLPGTELTNYTTTFSGACNSAGEVSLTNGDNKTCTITNTKKTQTPPSSGLVSHWKFDEGSGTSAIDSVGSNTGTFVGSPIYSTNKPSTSFSNSHSLAFDGTDYITINQSTALKPTTAYTVSTWVYRTAACGGNLPGIFHGPETSGQYGTYALVCLSSNKIALYHDTTGGAGWVYANTTALATNTWYHVVGVWDGSNIKIYLDGVLIDAKPATSLKYGSTAINAEIGRYNGTTFPGQIDDVRVYNQALTVEEIKGISVAPTSPALASLKTAADNFYTPIKEFFKNIFASIGNYLRPEIAQAAKPVTYITFSAPGTYTWTVPEGIVNESLSISIRGGGGGGGSGFLIGKSPRGGAGGGGGGWAYTNEHIRAGQYVNYSNYHFVSGDIIRLKIGAGGNSGQPGGESKLEVLTGANAGYVLIESGGNPPTLIVNPLSDIIPGGLGGRMSEDPLHPITFDGFHPFLLNGFMGGGGPNGSISAFGLGGTGGGGTGYAQQEESLFWGNGGTANHPNGFDGPSSGLGGGGGYGPENIGGKGGDGEIYFSWDFPVCNNGRKEKGEQCDDGAENGTCPETCSGICTLNQCDNNPVCGNGKTEVGEQCDPPGMQACSASLNTGSTQTITNTLNPFTKIESYLKNSLASLISTIIPEASIKLTDTTTTGSGEISFSAPGNNWWTIPPGVTQIFVKAWGPGGDGEDGTKARGGSGGGGGAYIEKLLPVIPCRAYNIEISDGLVWFNSAGWDSLSTLKAEGGSAGSAFGGGYGGGFTNNFTIPETKKIGGKGGTSFQFEVKNGQYLPVYKTGGGGGGGAGSASSQGTDGQGNSNTGGSGGNMGGGNGGDPGKRGADGIFPGGGGGGGGAWVKWGSEIIYGGEGAGGQITVSWSGGTSGKCSGINLSICADGIKESNEQCDDGNIKNDDGCSSTCQTETSAPPMCGMCSPVCQIVPISPKLVCGNGKIDMGEQCDPPNGTTCDVNCQNMVCEPLQTCGNGNIDLGEQCDPPNGVTCDVDCQNMTCEPPTDPPPPPPPPPPVCPAISATWINIIRGYNGKSGKVGTGVSIYEDGGADPNNPGQLLPSGQPDPDNPPQRLFGPKFATFFTETIGEKFTLDGSHPKYPYTNFDDVLKYRGLAQVGTSPNAQDPGAKDTCQDANHSYPCTQYLAPQGNFLTLIYSENELSFKNNSSNQTCGFFADETDLYHQNFNKGIFRDNRKMFKGYIFPVMP